MKVKKPILHTGTLKNNNTDVYYSPLFLENIAKQKGDIDIELNTHNGQSIGKVTDLSLENGELVATMDIPDEYINFGKDCGFSTEIIPSKWNGFTLEDGYLDKLVFINDLEVNKPNDTKTITKIYNTDGVGNINSYSTSFTYPNKIKKDDKMSEGNKLSEMYGKLEAEHNLLKNKYSELETEKQKIEDKFKKLTKQHETLQTSYDEGKALYEKGKQEYIETKKIADKYNKYLDDKKNTLLDKLVPSDDDGNKDEFKLKMYNKLDIEELESLVKDEPPKPSTPPNGASNGEQYVPQDPNKNSGDESMIYLNYKNEYNL